MGRSGEREVARDPGHGRVLAWSARWVGLASRHPVAILCVALLVSGVAGALVLRIRLNTNLVALLPSSTPSVRALHRILDKTGGFGDLMVMAEGPSPKHVRAFMAELLPRVKALPWVEEAAYRRDLSFFRKHRILYMPVRDLETILRRVKARVHYETLRANPMYVDVEDRPPPKLDFSDLEAKAECKATRREYFDTPDGKRLILVIRPRGAPSNVPLTRKIYRELSQLVSALQHGGRYRDLDVSVGGTFKNRLDEYDTILADVRSSAVWVGLGLVALLLLTFRRVGALVVLLVPLALSMAWTFALAELAIGSLNLVTVFLLVVLFGLGIDFGIHLLARYQEERGLGRGQNDALVQALGCTGRAAITAALTTAAAFLSLLVTRFRGFSEFGFIAGVGLIASGLAYFILLPVLVVLVERVASLLPRSAARAYQAAPKPLRLRFTVPVLVLGSLFTALAVSQIAKLGFEHDLRRIRSQVAATRDFNRKMRTVFSRARDAAAVLVPGFAEAAAVRREVEQIQGRMGGRSLIQEVWSIDRFLPQNQAGKMVLIQELRRLIDKNLADLPPKVQDKVKKLRRDLDVGPVTAADLPDSVRRPFLGRPGTPGQLVFIYQQRSLLDLRNALAFARAVREIHAGGRTYRPASEPLVYADMYQCLRHDAPIAMGLVLGVVFLTILVDLRSLMGTLLAFSPVLLGGVWLLGLLAAAGIRVNLLNAVALPSLVGLGVDSGVHLFHRYREAGRQALGTVVRRTAGPILASTLTSMLSFGSLVSAQHPGLRSIGVLALLGLGACLLASLLILPAILSLVPAHHFQRTGHGEGADDRPAGTLSNSVDSLPASALPAAEERNPE